MSEIDKGPTLDERYKILIEARNFHYDNFNKWTTYFYVAVGALFVGYTSFLSATEKSKLVECTILLLGFITSLLWYWSCKGYYYWNINFISLVNYYETELFKWNKEESVYSVFANKETQNKYWNPLKGANISTSKINILFAFIIACFWGALLSFELLKRVQCISDCKIVLVVMSGIIPVIFTILITVIIPQFFLQSYTDHMPDLKIEQKKVS